MFRCLECGEAFEETLEIQETHGLSHPPYEKRYVCPYCKGSTYRPFTKDSISRTKVIDELLDVMQKLNQFDNSICGAFNSTATDDTGLDFARSKLFELFTVLAEDDVFSLPRDIDCKIFDMRTNAEAAAVMALLTKNIEGD